MSDTLVQSTDIETGRAGEISRRTLLGRLALLLGMGAVGLGGCRNSDHEPLIAELIDLSPDREAAVAIGRAFLDKSKMRRNRLAARLALDLDWNPELDRTTLTTRLLERIQSDFRDGRTLRVEDWVLSQTEVWWAALVALA